MNTNKLNILDYCFVLVIVAIVGCMSTVAPKNISSPIASYDGNTQNSGIIGFNADGSLHITAAKRDQYNALVKHYGTNVEFQPALIYDVGIKKLPDGTFSLDDQHAIDCAKMLNWLRSGE